MVEIFVVGCVCVFVTNRLFLMWCWSQQLDTDSNWQVHWVTETWRRWDRPSDGWWWTGWTSSVFLWWWKTFYHIFLSLSTTMALLLMGILFQIVGNDRALDMPKASNQIPGTFLLLDWQCCRLFHHKRPLSAPRGLLQLQFHCWLLTGLQKLSLWKLLWLQFHTTSCLCSLTSLSLSCEETQTSVCPIRRAVFAPNMSYRIIVKTSAGNWTSCPHLSPSFSLHATLSSLENGFVRIRMLDIFFLPSLTAFSILPSLLSFRPLHTFILIFHFLLLSIFLSPSHDWFSLWVGFHSDVSSGGLQRH